MITYKMIQKINKHDAQWSRIKDNNPEMGEGFSVILENNFGQEVKLTFNRWVLDVIEKTREVEHPFRIGDSINRVNKLSFINGWKISSC